MIVDGTLNFFNEHKLAVDYTREDTIYGGLYSSG